MNITGTGASASSAELVQIGARGIVNYFAVDGGATMGSWGNALTLVTLDVNLSLTDSPLEVVTRVLASNFSLDDNYKNYWKFSDTKGDSLAGQEVTSKDELDLLGEYYFYQDEEGIKVDYVRVKTVPEPCTASLGLLALSSLLLRRRRN